MLSATYYPFTRPEKPSFIKTSLFLWDSVDFIVPFPGFKPYFEDNDEAEAMEIIGRPYVPTESDKKNTHDELVKICNGPLPKELLFDLSEPNNASNFYPQKLLPETWDLLSDSQLARIVKRGDGVDSAATSALFGYYMMSALAVCCTGDRKRLVTDNHDPYRTLSNIMVDEIDPDTTKDEWHGRLIATALSGPDFTDISLRRLIDLRKSEDQLLQGMRRIFTESVDKAASDIAKNANNSNVVNDILRNFVDKMEKDLQELKKALGRSALSLILSPGCAISVATYVAAAVAAPITAGVSLGAGAITVGGLARELNAYQDRRRKILKEHPSAWLMAAAGPKIPVT